MKMMRGFRILAAAAMGAFLISAGCRDILGLNSIEYEDPCVTDADCDDQNPCSLDTCSEGACAHVPAQDGAISDGIPGNCLVLVCTGGVAQSTPSADDLNDDNPCTQDSCEGGPSHTVTPGATCDSNGSTGVCSADGACVVGCGYLDANGIEVQCAAPPDPCTTVACDKASNQCVFTQLDGVPAPGTTPTECDSTQCVKGVSTPTPALADTPCSGTTPGGQKAIVCDGAGSCVECNSDEQCADPNKPPSFCFVLKCAANECANDVKDGVDLPMAQQIPSDCTIKQCAAGLVIESPDDTDLPDDNNQCTIGICTGGAPSQMPAPQGTSCGTGAMGNPLVCNGTGTCIGCNIAADCQGVDDDCKTRTCVNEMCGVDFQPSGKTVSGQTSGDCMMQVCDGAGNIVSALDNFDVPADDGNPCTGETCNNGTPAHPNKAAGTACNDGNACTPTDTCQAGACVGANPVVCTALDQCHDAGTCNPASGMCSNPTKANGAACNDGSACTQTDTCQNGACTGANPVVCAALDQCHNAGTCNPANGTCSNPEKPNGTACNDTNLCTQTDTCQTGICLGANPVVCAALDQCHVAGTCNTGTGVCSNPNKANGSACNDANPCRATDLCNNGVCAGTTNSPAGIACTKAGGGAGTCDGAGNCN